MEFFSRTSIDYIPSILPTMASRVLLLPLRSPLGLGLSLTAAYAFGTPLLPRPSGAQLLLSCDAEPFGRTSSDEWSYRRSPGARSGGVASPRVYRQISGGSIAGLVAGLAVSVFSRTLALLLGIVVFGVQVRFFFLWE